MQSSFRTTSLVLSILIAVGLIAGALFLSSTGGPHIADAGTSEELLRVYAEKDTDADGLFDWQEDLYGSDPKLPNSIDSALTDREAVDQGKAKPKFSSDTSALEIEEVLPGIAVEPETLTDRFARRFFESYLTGASNGSLPTSHDLIAFVNGEVDGLIAENTSSGGFTNRSLTTVVGGSTALHSYAAAIETAFAQNTPNTKESELVYFADAVNQGGAGNLEQVRRISDAYRATAAAFIRVPVPIEVEAVHLRTANALSKMAETTAYMAALETDPLLAFVGASVYEDSVKELVSALAAYAPIYASAGVILPEGVAGASFYALIQTSAAYEAQ